MNKNSGIVNQKGRLALLLLSAAGLAVGCHKSNVDQDDLKGFKQVNLVANQKPEYNPKTVDPTLINAFGLAWSPNGIAWVNSVGGHVSELYSADGDRIKSVNIPGSPAVADSAAGFPCGIVFNNTPGFSLANGKPSLFIFSGFDGVLSAWNGGTTAQFEKHPPSASYTGLAIAKNGTRDLIYAANFGQNRIDAWDSSFARVGLPFTDQGYPALPHDFSPYNIQAVGNYLIVMYDKLGADGHPVLGKGLGYVSVFNTDGSFVSRLASNGTLNAPWGVTMAAGSFLEGKDVSDGGNGDGGYGNNAKQVNNSYDPKDPVLLVGNFGDGRINVFSQQGRFIGQLQKNKQPISIEGLWALSFAPTGLGLDNRLYFTAGPDGEKDGLFGYLIKK